MKLIRNIWVTLSLAAASVTAQNVVAVRGATIHTSAGTPIPDGIIVARDGKIVAVGQGVSIPSDAKIYEAAGKIIIPGMLDEHSHIGAKPSDLNDRPMVIGPQHRFIDALDLDDPDWNEALKGGVTTVTTGPGSGENVSGQAIVIKTYGDDLGQANRERKRRNQIRHGSEVDGSLPRHRHGRRRQSPAIFHQDAGVHGGLEEMGRGRQEGRRACARLGL